MLIVRGQLHSIFDMLCYERNFIDEMVGYFLG